MAKIKVGVLRGGPSAEHDVSLKTGENILAGLSDKYQGVDVVLNKDGQLCADGSPAKIQHLGCFSDVIFNALHGYFGEDGKAQQIFNVLNIPYTGSGALASSLAMNKILSRGIFAKAGLKIPQAVVVKKDESLEQAALKVFRSISPSWVVKPASGGSSIGVSIVKDFNSLISAIEKSFNFCSNVIIEEYIKGREVTCGILENFRGEKYYALPAIEIVPPDDHDFFDYDVKYDGSTREICPADFELSVKRKIEEIARQAHQLLGCSGYSRADMIVAGRGIYPVRGNPAEVYLLEINTLPGLTSESLLPKAADAVGLSFPQLLDHIIDLALNKSRNL